MAERKLQLLITADAKQAQRALGNLEKTAGTTGKKTQSHLSGIQKGLVGLGAGGLAVGAFNAFEDAQKVAKQTEAVIKSTGGAANKSADDFAKLANSISRKTGIDDEQIQSSENMLATFTGIQNGVGKNNQIFDLATQAAVDMAAATGGDAVSAAKTLGKALNDPVKGLTKLTKQGVVFTDQQVEQVKALAASGDKMGAQKIILKELATEYGGSAEAQATASGKAKVAIDNLAESVGAVLAPALGAAANALATVATGFSNLPVGAQQATVGIAGITTAAVVAGPKLIEMAGTAQRAATSVVDMGLKFAGAVENTSVDRGISKKRAALLKLGEAATGTGDATGKFGKALAALGWIGAIAGASAYANELGKTKVSIEDALGATDKQIRENAIALNVLGDKGREAFDQLGKGDISILYRMRDALGEDYDAHSNLGRAIRETERAEKQKTETSKTYKEAIDNVTGSTDKTADSTEKATKKVEVFGAKLDFASDSMDWGAVAAKKQTDKLLALADGAKQAASNIDAFYDAQTRGLKTQIDVEAAWDKYTEGLFANTKTTDITTAAGRENQQNLIDLTNTMLEATKVERDKTAAMGDGTYATEAAITKMETYSLKLQEAMLGAGYTKDEIAVMIQTMGLTPTQIETTFKSNQVAQEQELRKGLLATIFAVPHDKTTTFHANTKPAMDDIQAMINALAGQTPVGTLIPSPYGAIPGTLTFPSKARAGGSPRPLGSGGTSGSVGGSVGGRSLSAGGDTVVVVQLDGKEISRHVVNQVNGQHRSTGRNPLVATGRR